ncbi:fatty acid synthase-like [Cataglyphis hispanica]|uniref:fatty acid synthase-like n=1 Tax=Cataglyphis hispanica TaxID=1086592 RepID=UPI00217F911D|nr:fatty acid synthase-like [Cataglyphis hispanica]XP_050452237.1 fatty acid synthase-like [Cataglyphis hispanica]
MENNKRFNPYVSVDAKEEIVISGIARRFPNCDNIKEFQDNIFNKMNLGSSDHQRWTNYIYEMPARIGKINNIQKFDSEFFNISTEEAHVLDPGCRMLLEHTYEAIIDAGVNPAELQGTNTSVITAISVSDTFVDLTYEKLQIAGLPILGCSKNMIASRISYWLGVTGPTYNIDTACSSSHFAMVEAYRMIRSGICEAAIVASINICNNPSVTHQFFCLGVLSTDGYCKPYDEEGNGYMRSDSAAVMYLQKAKDARRIYATFVYGKTNCDGFKEEGITFPSFDKQKMLLEEFYEDCDISPLELFYIEAHATGTLAGDPVELRAIDEALCAKRQLPLLLGSVKSNIGHSEATSGHCQIAKILIAMETGILAPTIHFKRPRKNMPAIIEGRVKIITEPTEYKDGYIGINSFGFGGANCHILLKPNPKIKINNEEDNNLPRLVAISGCTEEAVKIILDDVQNRSIDVEYISLLHRIHNDNIKGHSYRGYIIAGSNISDNAIIKIERNVRTKRPICFIFSGLGSQCFNMGRALMKFPAFTNAIQKCDTILRPYNISVTDIIINKNKDIVDNVVHLFVGLIGLQIGIIDLLTSIGITPDIIMGHSIGELICGYVDGCLTADETIMLAYYVGLAFFKSKIIDGLMAEINLNFEIMKNICPSDIDVACYNNLHNSIVSGPKNSVRTFLAKLQNENISVKEISFGSIPFHSRYVEPARVKLLEYLNQILPQQVSPSSKWLSESYEWFNTSPKLSLAKYYAHHLLAPVLFSKSLRFIPNNAVIIEIASHNILQYILNDSLETTVTNVALEQFSHKPNIETFLHGIGKLYNAGLQPKIANLYPEVKFPVSRGTPMISHLIRWDHSKDWYIFRYTGKKTIDKGEIIVTIDVSEEEFIYMTGHVINGKNLLPATGYLLLIWQMVGWLKKQYYIDIPIVFEDVNFLRSTILPKQSSIDLTLMMQKGSNKFEIIEGNNIIVTGTVRIPINIEDEKICTTFIDRNDTDEEVMNTKDIYKELKLRDYQYTGEFRGLKSASIRGKNGHIVWTDNWATFMDNMLQMMILGLNSKSLFVPTRIRKVVIDPESHIKQIEKLPNEEKQVLVQNYKHLDALISGGIEISGILATVISRQQRAIDPVLEEYKFVAHQDLDVMSLEDTTRMSVHIALECYNMINVKIMEFVEDSDQVIPENLNCLFVNKVLEDFPQNQADIKLVATHERFKDITLSDNISTIEFDKLTKSENCLMIIGYEILTKNKHELYERLLSVIMPKGFLLTFEELDAIYDYSCLDKYGLKVILEKRTNDKTIILLRKIHDIERSQQIVHINNYEFSWIGKLKSFMNIENETTRIIVVAEGDFECGLIGLVNCLRKEPGGKMIRGVFIQDKDAPTFSLQEPLYRSQLQLDLPINVIRSRSIWGSYRHFPLPLPQPKLVKSAYVSQMVRGDLSTFCWMQSMISLVNNDEENLIRIVYASINFRDVMTASGRLISTSVAPFEQNNSSLIGMEFVGFNKNGQRVMGMCPNSGFTNVYIADKYLSWVIPDQWTMEDAATVPCVYSTCYYALYLRGKMKKGDKVLIHSGTGGVGQAAIHLALYEGCEIFTTVGSSEKRNFIRETFPSIPEDHIGNSRDTSFEQMIIQKTNGRGVDIVLNSLAEEKLQTSIRCLAKGGRFLEIGKFDMISNNPLEIFSFSKGISFHGIILDNWIFCAKKENKMILHNIIIEGIKKGAIKPLCRKVFERDEIETAFRYMAAGKHIGKIIIKIRKENEPLDAPILAHPRYYCLERKCYIVLGGLGGFGLELIDWLILRGAKNLVVTSRTGIKNGYQRSRVTLWQSYGVNIQIVTAVDTSRYRDCEYILKFAEEQGPVDAIFNLAVVLKDDIFKNQSPQTFEETFVSKAWTTKKMDELSRTICTQLRHFVVFSSFSCGRGNAGQTNYGMANSVMERICERRKKEGLHGLAIQWGAIGEVGLVADMRQDDKELVIGGTLQQKISSCLDTLEVFLLQDRSIVSSMVVAEKKISSQAMNPLEAIANIMGFKNLNIVAPNVSLAELGVDSMMAVEIKQTLEREFDILLTEQDIRNLNFAALRKMINATEQGKTYDVTEAATNILDSFEMFTQKLKDSDLNPNIYVELDTKREVTGNIIFLIPGVDGSASVYKLMESKIKSMAMCLQHGAINMPDVTRSVMKSAAYLLPYVMEKMKDQKEFLIVGYSFGSLIAIELTRLLEAKNFIGRLILIDGAPDWTKFLNKKYFNHTSQQELENDILLLFLKLYLDSDNEMIALDLKECSTWEEKLELITARFSEKINTLSVENQKLLCTTVYDHIIAAQDYDISSLSRIKSSVILLKPTLTPFTFPEEDYGLHKITESAVQIHYIEGSHITMMDKIASFINEAF